MARDVVSPGRRGNSRTGASGPGQAAAPQYRWNIVQGGRMAEEQEYRVGLGLATSRELARDGRRAHRGERAGESSTFTLKLPRSA